MSGPKHLFWDSCVFIRYLTKSPPEFGFDIDQYVAQAKRGEVNIHFSTIAFAEIRQSYFKGANHRNIRELFASLGRNFIPQDPNPNIMIAAGLLRDARSTNPNPKEPRTRIVGTADAIHLMTCIYLRDVAGLSDIEFHTFDEGKGPSWEGRCIPLLGFERWFPSNARSVEVEKVCALPKKKPKHPDPDMVTRAGTPALEGPSPSSKTH